MAPREIDIRDLKIFDRKQITNAKIELSEDEGFQREMKQRGVSIDELFKTTYPLKYLGIELHNNGKNNGTNNAKSRFDLSDVLRIALRPRSMDGTSKGLRLSNHRMAFIERFPDVDALLQSKRMYQSAVQADVSTEASFRESRYAKDVRVALKLLEDYVKIPIRISLEVLRKGLAAFRNGHRPGMSAHGWARARLTSFCMKGCTHYFPDHKLVEQCPEKKTIHFWKGLPCLCKKPSQCENPGKRTPSNTLARRPGK